MKTTLFLATALAVCAAAPRPAEAGLIRSIFKSIAAHKQDRVFHEKGEAYHATFTKPDGTVAPAVVRFSRGRPSAPGKKEILGVAVKVKEAGGDQDFLMVTANADRGIKARVFKLSDRFAGSSISSLLSFSRDGERGPITSNLPTGITTALDASGRAKGTQRFDVGMWDATPGGKLGRAFVYFISGGVKAGPTQLGQVAVDMSSPLNAQENASLKFTPFNDAEGVKPVGVINWIRKAAYLGSQAGRGAK